MNNLTQEKLDAKEAYLNQQSERMLALYETADANERKAIIVHIDSFLSTCNQKSFLFLPLHWKV